MFGYSPDNHVFSPDDGMLYVPVTYATGDRSTEQVMGWDDMQDAETWGFISELGPTAIGVPARLLDARECERLAAALLLPILVLDREVPGLWISNDRDLFAFLGARSMSDGAV